MEIFLDTYAVSLKYTNPNVKITDAVVHSVSTESKCTSEGMCLKIQGMNLLLARQSFS